jgi:LmbE family N-acetylglucosaminyl deacetylase
MNHCDDHRSASKIWLILSDNPAEVADHEVTTGEEKRRFVHGCLDQYPDLPAGYDRIQVSAGMNFWRWSRWYLQDFSRQLKPGGIMVLVGNPFYKTHSHSLLSKIKRQLLSIMWHLACRTRIQALQCYLVPRTFLNYLPNQGLEITRTVKASDGSHHGLCLRKLADNNNDKRICDQIELEKLFQKYFGEWIEETNHPKTWQKLPLHEPAALLDKPMVANVLVLSPHPDDELIGCGGTLLGLAAAGASIHVVQMTEGMTCQALKDVDEKTRRGIRWKEAEAVAKRFGFTGHYWKTGNMGNLEANAQNHKKLSAMLVKLQPSLIFIPSVADLHPEHRIAHQIFQATKHHLPKSCRILEYPVWGFLPKPNIAVDVTAHYSQVLDALYLYKTAMKAVDYIERCKILSSWYNQKITEDDQKSHETFMM